MKDLIIIGVGGVGREAALIAEEINEQTQEWNILGFVDDNESVQNTYINGYPVLGKSHYLQSYKEEVYVFCGISNYKVKKKIISKLKENQNIRIIRLCLDNDGPGRVASSVLKDKYESRGYKVIDLPPPKAYKDYNDWIKSLRSKKTITMEKYR